MLPIASLLQHTVYPISFYPRAAAIPGGKPTSTSKLTLEAGLLA
jgi:hypothetical protein